ncbi:MAG: YgiQ family radical SAM protein, partial [Planctomycetaceae bacterium]|nr:YgiQ family radical SAM protein [Planctomycetaceae bacterium]
EVDVVFVTGDAYVDHPSFAAALLARVLEADGFRVGILAQPDWHSAQPWTTFGQPVLAFCVSAGNMDSMINHYTANRKVRNEDAYSPNGKIGLRPDRATLSYCQRAREAYSGCTVIAGGVEASLRRLAHYDYWSDKVKRSMVLDSKADLLVYGMGETPLLQILQRLRNGEPVSEIRNVRGTAYRLKQTEDLPEETETTIHLPTHEEVEEDKSKFSKMTRIIYENLNPYLGVTLVQEHALEAVVVNPPSFPLQQSEMDKIYALPFTRKPHPIYSNAKIPAWEMIKDSVQIHRGCFGGCSFCSLSAHQGKFIQSRSRESIVTEINQIAAQPEFHGVISDLGGPSANMFSLGCQNAEAQNVCRKTTCLTPEPCPNLNTDHSELIELLRAVRNIPAVKQVFVASGVRTDLALLDESYIKELVEHHIGGHLKTAPEHTNATVLKLMNKPPIDSYDQFCSIFASISANAGKEQYLVPYLMAGFPGTTLKMMVETALYLKKHGIRSEQVQEFIPGPFELASSIYYTGINPLDGQPVYVPKKLRERRLQKALLMYDDPNNYHDIKSALHEAGRDDLIGNSPDCLIPPYPPKSLALRRSSKVKRLQKQNEMDKKIKTERRQKFELEFQKQNKTESRDRTENRSNFQNRDRFEDRERPQHRDRFENRERPQHRDHFENRERPQNRDRFENRERPQHRDRFENRERPQNRNNFENRERPQHRDRFENRERPQHRDRFENRERPQHRNNFENRERPQHRNNFENRERPQNRNNFENRERPQNRDRNQSRDRFENSERPQNRDRFENRDRNQNRDRFENRNRNQNYNPAENRNRIQKYDDKETVPKNDRQSFPKESSENQQKQEHRKPFQKRPVKNFKNNSHSNNKNTDIPNSHRSRKNPQ